jgi:hypothetical protein
MPIDGRRRAALLPRLLPKTLPRFIVPLERLSFSVFTGRCDPNDANGYPARILKWQYCEGLILPETKCAVGGLLNVFRMKSLRYVAERQFELSRQLALFLVAEDADTSPEYLRKLCRDFEPSLADSVETGPPSPPRV